MKYTEYNSKLIDQLIDEWSHGLPDESLTQSELHQFIRDDLRESIEWVDLEDTHNNSKAIWMSMDYVVNTVTRAVWKRNKKYLEEMYED